MPDRLHTPGTYLAEMDVQGQWPVLKQLAGTLMDPANSPGHLFQACEALYQLFLETADVDLEDPQLRRDAQTPGGKALAPIWAALCIKDFQRTCGLLRGLLAAIQRAGERFPNTTIHVLYAGCGPFASLAVPLIPLLEGQPVAFTLLDVSPISLGYVEKTIANLDMAPWILEIVLADATQYQVDPTMPVHVVVTEMMQTGLQHEPQVAAMWNLVPQLLAGGFIIPESITVQAGLLHPGRNMDRMLNPEGPDGEVYQLLEPAFEWSPATISAKNDGLIFPEIEVEIPVDRDPDFKQLALFTRIRIFEEICLEAWDCALTLPLPLMRLEPDESRPKIGLRYRVGTDPGFQWRVIN